MIRLTVSGTTYELKHYMGHLEKDRIYQIVDRSKTKKNKRDTRTFHIFVNVDKKTKVSANREMMIMGQGGEALCAR